MRATILLVCFVVGAPLAARAHGRRSSAAAEEAQRRELMAELAAAAAEGPAMPPSDDNPNEKTDADLMYEAMRQWRGEPRGSAAVARVLAETQRVHQERKVAEAKLRSLFFKDPFAEDPELADPGAEGRSAIAGGVRSASRHRSLDGRTRGGGAPARSAGAGPGRCRRGARRGEPACAGSWRVAATARTEPVRPRRRPAGTGASTAAARWPPTIAFRTTGLTSRHRRADTVAPSRAPWPRRQRPRRRFPRRPRPSSPRRRPAGAAATHAGSSSSRSRRPSRSAPTFPAEARSLTCRRAARRRMAWRGRTPARPACPAGRPCRPRGPGSLHRTLRRQPGRG